MLNWLDAGIKVPTKRGNGETRSVPIFSDVPAGKMMVPEAVSDPRNIYGHIVISGLGRGDWAALVVSGSSMNKVAPDGSTIVFNRADTQPVDNGFFVFRDPDTGAATFKRYGGGHPPRLRPYSYDDYDPIILTSEDQVEIVGRVKKVVVDL
jgi:SOS-response transcriptional repressor LexA